MLFDNDTLASPLGKAKEVKHICQKSTDEGLHYLKFFSYLQIFSLSRIYTATNDDKLPFVKRTFISTA